MANAQVEKTMIFGMPTFEEQVKQKSKQRQVVEARLQLAKAKRKKKSSENEFIGPTYMKYVAGALVTSMNEDKKMADFIKLHQYYSDLMQGLYKAISSLSNYDDLEEFLKDNSFYEKLGSVGNGDIRNFLQFAKDELKRFEGSKAYQEEQSQYQHEQSQINKYEHWIHSPKSTGARRAVGRRRLRRERGKQQNTENEIQNLKQGELSIIQHDAGSLKNHADSGSTFSKQLQNDEKSVLNAYSGIGDFSINIALGYANDLS